MSAHDIALAITDRLEAAPCPNGHVAGISGHLVAFNHLRSDGVRPAECYVEIDDEIVFHCRVLEGWRDDPSKVIETPLGAVPPTGWLGLFNKAVTKSNHYRTL